MAIRYEFRMLRPEAIFDVADQFVRDRSASATRAGPPTSVTFRVIGPWNGAEFPRQPELVTTRNESGYHIYFGEVRLPDEEFQRPRARDRGIRRNLLADGAYAVSVEADAYAPERIRLEVPNPQPGVPIPVPLRPGHGYPFRNAAPLEPPSLPGSCVPALQREGPGPSLLRGSLHAVDGTPIAGASIVAPGVAGPFFTGPTGDWLLVLPDWRNTGLITVRVTLPDGTRIDVPNVCVVRGREVALRETVLRGWVLQGRHGVSGATVTVTGQPGVSTTGSDGGWFHYFSPDPNALPAAPVTVVATLATGETQMRTETVKERATTLVPTFRFP